MLPGLNEASALLSVVIIDVVLAGDNAIIVGMAAAGLPPERRRRVILLGIGAATLLRILFAFVALELLQSVIGMTAAGGLLLLWVAWKMYREIRASQPVPAHAIAMAGEAPSSQRRGKTTAQAIPSYAPKQATAHFNKLECFCFQQYTLQPGESFTTFDTFVTVHRGDYFVTLDAYRRLMAERGMRQAKVPASAYDGVWCAWGYERDHFDVSSSI